MSTSQLKNLVIDRIYGIEDEELLTAFKKILDSSISGEVAYRLTDEQRQAVREGRRQIAIGEYVTNDDLEKAEDRWLKE
jgi:predicted transcriptional regulator